MTTYDIFRIMKDAQEQAGVNWDAVAMLVLGLVIGMLATHCYHRRRTP